MDKAAGFLPSPRNGGSEHQSAFHLPSLWLNSLLAHRHTYPFSSKPHPSNYFWKTHFLQFLQDRTPSFLSPLPWLQSNGRDRMWPVHLGSTGWGRGSRQVQVCCPKLNNIQWRFPRSSCCGSVVTNLTSTHEDAGLIPGLSQWVKGSALLWAVVEVTDASRIPCYCVYGVSWQLQLWVDP